MTDQTILAAVLADLEHVVRRPAFDGTDAFIALAAAAEAVEAADVVETGGDAVSVKALARILRGEDLPPARQRRRLPAEPVEPEPVEPEPVEPEPVEPEPAEPEPVGEDHRHKFTDAELLATLTAEPQRAAAVARALGVKVSSTATERCEAADGAEVLPRRPGRATLVRLANAAVKSEQ